MRIEGVFFDLYGTLLLYGDMTSAWSSWLSALHRWLEEHAIDIDTDDLSNRCQGFFSRPEPRMEVDGSTLYEHRLLTLWRELGSGNGLPEPGAGALRDGARITIDAWQRYVTLDPQADAVLSEVGRDRPLALISNFDHPPHVEKVIAEHGLRHHFSTITVSAAIGFKKPDPRIFAPALELLDLSVKAVAYVGDAPEDVEGAQAAGLTAIRIERSDNGEGDRAADFRHAGPRDGSKIAGHLRIESLEELPAALESLQSSSELSVE